MRLLGCDFSSRPSARKPIVLAFGALEGRCVALEGLSFITTLEGYADWLRQPGEWVGGFDFPFGLPRELVQALGWPLDWEPCLRHYAALSREQIRDTFAAFCNARPAGAKFAHRATDGPAGSSPSMKWVNPPVAYMIHAGVPPLLAAHAYLPGLWEPDPPPDPPGGETKVALEAYPGLLARAVLGRQSYKSDDRVRQTPDRRAARHTLVQALEAGQTPLNITLALTAAQRQALLDDARGDSLDAVLCLMQAAWALARHRAGHPRYGLPAEIDPLEGWIVTA